MELIDSSVVFTFPEEIFLRNSLKPSTTPRDFQKLLAPFTDGEVKEHDQKTLKYLNLVKETPQT